MRYIVTNFAYGYGPFLRTTELALAINAELVAHGKEPLGIIVPWVYGEKQKKLLLEEFSDHADTIFLDATLGAMLKTVFYADSTYEETLIAWIATYESISQAAHDHLSGTCAVESLSGTATTLAGSDIVLELGRASRVTFNVAPSYSATFGHISEILKETLTVSTKDIAANREVISEAILIAEKIEHSQKLIGVAEPATFSYKQNRVPLKNEIAIPPTIHAPREYTGELEKGIYATVTGIPGLERLYAEAQSLGLVIYSNEPDRLPGSIYAPIDSIASDAIVIRFARSGWGSVWGSMLLGKAIIVPEFDPADDPEIYFNNLCVEKLGLGIIYRGEPLTELLEKADALEPGIQARNAELLARFGTLDGNEVMAKRIADDLDLLFI